MQKRPVMLGLTVCAALLVGWGGYRCYRAWRNLVTLDVRNADVRLVVKKLRSQTWERFIVHKDVTGKVSFRVKNTPLVEVLNIISEQLECRWNSTYPLYSSRKSLVAFEKSAQGIIEPADYGWTNLNFRGSFGRGGGGMFGENLRNENDRVSFDFQDKDLDIAIMALGRFARARVVPEDGASGKLHLKLENVLIEKAIARVAKQVHRDWECYYTLSPGFGFGRGPDDGRGGRRERGDRAERRPFDGPPPWARENQPPIPEQVAANPTNSDAGTNIVASTNFPPAEPTTNSFRQRFEQVLATLPEAERQRMDQQRQQMREQMRDPAVRGQFFENRMRSRILNTTPQQRAARDRVRYDRQKQREQRQQQNQGR